MLLTTSMPRRLHLALAHLRRHPPQPMEPLPNLASRVITSRQVGAEALAIANAKVQRPKRTVEVDFTLPPLQRARLTFTPPRAAD